MPSAERLGPLYSQTAPAGLVRLQSHLLSMFPRARAGGMYNPTSRLSGGGPSPHRVTQALDVMCDRDTAAAIIRYLLTIAEALNLQQCIAWHEIVTVQRWREGIRWYPESDHSDGNGHAHIHVGLNASRNFDVSWIGGAHVEPPKPKPKPPPPPPPIEENPMLAFLYGIPSTHQTVRVDQNGNVVHGWWNGKAWDHDLLPGMTGIDPRSLSVIIDPRDLSLHVYGSLADRTGARHAWWNFHVWDHDRV